MSGENIVTLALSDYGSNNGPSPQIYCHAHSRRWLPDLSATNRAVPCVDDASAVLVSARVSNSDRSSVDSLVLIDLPCDSLSAEPVLTTNHQPQSNLSQHLHGDIGSDVDYPVHRCFLRGMQLANATGSASSHLARLGRLVASDAVGGL